jgi:hypothetical protein
MEEERRRGVELGGGELGARDREGVVLAAPGRMERLSLGFAF